MGEGTSSSSAPTFQESDNGNASHEEEEDDDEETREKPPNISHLIAKKRKQLMKSKVYQRSPKRPRKGDLQQVAVMGCRCIISCLGQGSLFFSST